MQPFRLHSALLSVDAHWYTLLHHLQNPVVHFYPEYSICYSCFTACLPLSWILFVSAWVLSIKSSTFCLPSSFISTIDCKIWSLSVTPFPLNSPAFVLNSSNSLISFSLISSLTEFKALLIFFATCHFFLVRTSIPKQRLLLCRLKLQIQLFCYSYF